MTRPKKIKTQTSLPTVRANAGGIDVGATVMYAAVPPDRAAPSVRKFATFTEDLHALADWLVASGVVTVAMESTGVYWIPLFQILEDRGIEVCLVNARHVKNVPGRKTDVQDCQWLQFLHAVGLLRASFRPPQAICAVRTIRRHRDNQVLFASEHVQHIQKALTQMNLQLHNVISNIVGATGQAMLDAILAGERCPKKLVQLKDHRIKAANTTIEKSLVGDYRPEHLFTLRQSLQAWRFYQTQIRQCDLQIQQQLAAFASRIDPQAIPLADTLSSRRKPQGNALCFNARTELYRICGVDLTAIPGFEAQLAHTVISETGIDLKTRFASANHFASWLGLCPDNRITGGRVLSAKTRKVVTPAATAFRLAAQSAGQSHTSLGDFHRRMRARLGPPKAITATAHKIARIVYGMLTTQTPYDETIRAKTDRRTQEQLTNRLKTQARKLGFHLVPIPPLTDQSQTLVS
jgi:transposase